MGRIKREPWKVLDQYRGTMFTGEWPTLPEMFLITEKRFGERRCFSINDADAFCLTFTQARERIEALAGYFVEQGIKRGDRIAFTGKNSPEWAITYLASVFAGAVVVPIDHSLRIEECDLLVANSAAKILVCDEEKYDAYAKAKKAFKLLSLSKEKPGYVMDLGGDKEAAAAQRKAVVASDLAAILYTSGTTGNPKGVMLSHSNFVADAFLAQGNLPIYETDIFYALLPIHHSYTMLAVFLESMCVGAEIVFAKKMAIGQIMKDLREMKITMFLGVPMLFNKVLAGIMSKIKAKGPLVYGLIRFLMAISGFIKKTTGINPGKSIFKSILKQANLYSIRICISGGGPLAASVFRDYNCLGIDFVQGYGLTETSPIIALNPTEYYKPASVGAVIPGIEMKTINVDEEGNGELVVKGPAVMMGYYLNDEATRDAFTPDGWFKTGDVGHIDQEDYVYLSGRAKNMIVTEGGKNVYPEEIEDCFQLYGEVDQVLVRGYMVNADRRTEGIEALIFPSEDFFRQKAQAEGKEFDKAAIEARVKQIVDEVNQKNQSYKRIVKFELLTEALVMTSTKKVKRFTVKAS